MIRAVLRPGAVGPTPATHTLPADQPNMRLVVSAEIWRPSNGVAVDNHLAAAVQGAVPVNDHPEADVVAALDDHAAHGHDITTVVPAGGGAAMLDPLVPGALEGVGPGGQTNPGAVDVLAAPQAHGPSGVPNDVVHGYGAGVALVHAVAAGAIQVATAPVLVTNRTFTLTVATLAQDLLVLVYLEEGGVAAP